MGERHSHPPTALRHACTAPCRRSCGCCCCLLLLEGEEEACMTMDRTFSSALGSPFSNACSQLWESVSNGRGGELEHN